jgi:hypothetical protein
VILPLSTVSGILYIVKDGNISGNASTGLDIASYILTCLSIILALFGAAQYLGLQPVDSYSWAYDAVLDEEVVEGHNARNLQKNE